MKASFVGTDFVERIASDGRSIALAPDDDDRIEVDEREGAPSTDDPAPSRPLKVAAVVQVGANES